MRWLRVGVPIGLAVAALAFAPAVAATADALPRATADRPDDRTGAQIHVIYVLPSDGVDRDLDTNGTINASVANWERWLRGQTGGRALRLDTYQSELDVTFHRLSQTDAQLAAQGVFIRDAIERELRSAGFPVAGRIYAVYYDGSSRAACGGGAWPPTLPGNVGAVYMRATYGAGLLCYDPARSLSGLQIMDLAVLHEVLHTMGLVATCAPHHTRAGHVSDSPSDLMYAGDQPWVPSALDVGRDDYFDAPVPGCLDLADSLYLEASEPYTLTVSASGAGSVTSEPAAISCPSTCSAPFERGATVRLVARPATTAAFVGWGGACTGRLLVCQVTMDAEKSVTASFGRRMLKLTVLAKGSGRVASLPPGIACPGRCSASFPRGARVRLVAFPKQPARRHTWSGACRGSGACSLVMDADRSVTATFRR